MIKFKEDCFFETTHRIVVKCEIAYETDVKTFSIMCRKSNTSELFNHIKQILENYIECQKKKLYFEEDCLSKKKTHRVQIVSLKENKTLSFGIQLSSHSSKDIMNVIYPSICNGRKKNWNKKNERK